MLVVYITESIQISFWRSACSVLHISVIM